MKSRKSTIWGTICIKNCIIKLIILITYNVLGYQEGFKRHSTIVKVISSNIYNTYCKHIKSKRNK